MGLKDRRILLWAGAFFLFSVGLGTAGLIPVPVVSFSWSPSRSGIGEPYRPAFRVDDNRELVMAYIGSRHCAASNDPVLPQLVETLKHELLGRAEEANTGFSAVGVGIDWLPVDGWRHLAGFGAFDEIVVGRKWSGLGARHFMKESIAGTAATPQVLVYERRRSSDGEGITSAWENVILARKVGVSRIQNWIDNGVPLRSVP